ncbi:tenascin-N isoform X2 [Periophthalmus magnuspinnatus]|uniref:tenascin-N isoform X2 n=1 Tax=Periophthalmus magnuspinnatus TaxID=409849 RepID=UPI0024366E59|nr:tenascin-N isoform X2 [Periophthalmus magnuspinnatus]
MQECRGAGGGDRTLPDDLPTAHRHRDGPAHIGNQSLTESSQGGGQQVVQWSPVESSPLTVQARLKAMTTRLLWRARCWLILLCTLSGCGFGDEHSGAPAPEQGVTFSHVYKIDIPATGSSCKLEPLSTDDKTDLQSGTTTTGENDIIFRHNIKLQTPKCDCEESESFKSLLYRVNGLEEEVNYLKTQCDQGCCGKATGVDTSCSGHGTYQHESCSCQCDPGWEGPDCSVSTCPDDCNDNGRCVDGKCVCLQGYTGHDCSQAACPDNCNDKGQCVDGKCVCFPHFTGEDCSVQRCPNDCIGNGKCVDGKCVCDEGFFGDDCSLVMTPQGLRLVTVTDVSLLVEWEHVKGAEHYILTHHPKDDEGALQKVQVPNTENSYLITGLTPGVTYIVQVYAVIREIQSEPDKITATTEVSAIDDLQVVGQTDVTIEVDWQNPLAPVDSFRVTHTNPSGKKEEQDVQRSQEARTKHTIVGLYPGTEYFISVSAVKEANEGKASTTTGVTDIDAPKDLKAVDVTMDTATVTWVPPLAEIQGYILTYRDEEGKMETVEKKLGARHKKLALSALEMGKKYIVTIIAYKGTKRSKVVETVFKTVGLMYPFPMDCTQIMKNGILKSGIYTIYINNDQSKPIEVYCDMDTDGGGWLVLQRRTIGKLDFMKRWKQYIAGFGNMTEEFWLGLEKIYDLTNTPTQYEIRFDLGYGSERVYAVYDNFKIAPVKQKFKLTIGKYRGTAGDAMTYHQGRPWTTVDNDNDIALGNCALTHRGAWWYKNCHLANLNGKWGDNRHSTGVNWEPWKGHLESLDFTEMKIRPLGALAS